MLLSGGRASPTQKRSITIKARTFSWLRGRGTGEPQEVSLRVFEASDLCGNAAAIMHLLRHWAACLCLKRKSLPPSYSCRHLCSPSWE